MECIAGAATFNKQLRMDRRRRLTEVAFPPEEVPAHARREKNVRHAHISPLDIWWTLRSPGAVSCWTGEGELDMGFHAHAALIQDKSSRYVMCRCRRQPPTGRDWRRLGATSSGWREPGGRTASNQTENRTALRGVPLRIALSRERGEDETEDAPTQFVRKNS